MVGEAEADYIPEGVTWIRDAVARFDPGNNAVITENGERITYDQLVVASGIQLDWGKIKGLEGNLGKDGICSNYRYEEDAPRFQGRKRDLHVPLDADLAEFVDQSQERYSMYALKAYGLPEMYWNGMLRGRM